MTSKLAPTILTIFGASGDLAKRKLVPAVYNLLIDDMLPDHIHILGVGRDGNQTEFRANMKAAIAEFSRRGAADEAIWAKFENCITYMTGDFETAQLYTEIASKIADIEKKWACKPVRINYLSIPPSFIEIVIDGLSKAHLTKDRKRDRIVIEKPFGRDLASATNLNKRVMAAFDESQVFRIDHYLGKETVQNLLAFRFANALYEPIWDRKYIDHVQITVAEEVGVELRGGFYETAGALRDMVQNHILQILCTIAMEPPISFDADEVRNKKVDVLRAIRPIPQDQIYQFAVRGQYGAGMALGKEVVGYRSEPGVNPNSSTETFAALKLFVDNWRWQDVPFYVRTGKRLPSKVSQISIQFRPVPHLSFPMGSADHWEPNRLIINIQPKEGIVMRFQAKQPGKGMRLRTVNMDFYYSDSFNVEPAEAYETLLYDVMVGDNTLFMRADQEHFAWTIIDPILQAWANTPSADFPNYPAGTWGPESAEALIARDGRSWHSLPLRNGDK